MPRSNVHIKEFKKIKLPIPFLEEDRGLKRCGTPMLALASQTDSDKYKNDIKGIALVCDSLAVKLEKSDGTVIPALGQVINFPNSPDAKGFIIDWRQHLSDIDCYKVIVEFSIAGFSGSYYHGAYNLRHWTLDLAMNTVQVYAKYNDFSREENIDYSSSDFFDSVRFLGTFGKMQPNYTTTNITYHNRQRKKVRRESSRVYQLVSSYLLNCLTYDLEKQLLRGNDIWITEHNPFAHNQYREHPVIVDAENSPSFEYTLGEYATVTATFLDKAAIHESKFS